MTRSKVPRQVIVHIRGGGELGRNSLFPDCAAKLPFAQGQAGNTKKPCRNYYPDKALLVGATGFEPATS
jgi:hypothetical protein